MDRETDTDQTKVLRGAIHRLQIYANVIAAFIHSLAKSLVSLFYSHAPRVYEKINMNAFLFPQDRVTATATGWRTRALLHPRRAADDRVRRRRRRRRRRGLVDERHHRQRDDVADGRRRPAAAGGVVPRGRRRHIGLARVPGRRLPDVQRGVRRGAGRQRAGVLRGHVLRADALRHQPVHHEHGRRRPAHDGLLRPVLVRRHATAPVLAVRPRPLPHRQLRAGRRRPGTSACVCVKRALKTANTPRRHSPLAPPPG